MVELYRNTIAKSSLGYLVKDLKALTKLVRPKPDKLELLKKEIDREKENRETWRRMFVPAYFESEWGKAFLEMAAPIADHFMQTSENFSNHMDLGRKELYQPDSNGNLTNL